MNHFDIIIYIYIYIYRKPCLFNRSKPLTLPGLPPSRLDWLAWFDYSRKLKCSQQPQKAECWQQQFLRALVGLSGCCSGWPVSGIIRGEEIGAEDSCCSTIMQYHAFSCIICRYESSPYISIFIGWVWSINVHHAHYRAFSNSTHRAIVHAVRTWYRWRHLMLNDPESEWHASGGWHSPGRVG